MSKKIWFSQALLLLMISLTTTPTASAAFFDWTAINAAISNRNQWSFDMIYNGAVDNQGGAQNGAPAPVATQATAKSTKPSSEAKKSNSQSYVVTVTAYSSTPDQTDSTPFITASGTNVRDGIIATNFLPFGTLVRIPEVFGNKIFRVEDRMNSRYWKRVDIWFPERQMAREFGIKAAKIEIVPES